MENPYSKALEAQLAFWGQFRLTDKVKSITESVETITKSQDASVKSRKELASRTKEIRTIATSERLAYMKGLLKSYQEEIDHLTMRAQFVLYVLC